MKWSYKRCDKLVSNSVDTEKDLISNHIINKNMAVIDNPVLPSNYINLSKEYNEFINSNLLNKKFILSVGRLTRQKNHSGLIDAYFKIFDKIDDVPLVIIGDGECFNSLINKIKDLKIEDSVYILKPVKNPYPFYRAASVFVLNSLYEGFGNVLVEALSLNCSVISTDCSGGPSSILCNGKYGTLVTTEDTTQLANQMWNVIDKDIIFNVSNDYIEKFTSDYISHKYLD